MSSEDGMPRDRTMGGDDGDDGDDGGGGGGGQVPTAGRDRSLPVSDQRTLHTSQVSSTITLSLVTLGVAAGAPPPSGRPPG